MSPDRAGLNKLHSLFESMVDRKEVCVCSPTVRPSLRPLHDSLHASALRPHFKLQLTTRILSVRSRMNASKHTISSTTICSLDKRFDFNIWIAVDMKRDFEDMTKIPEKVPFEIVGKDAEWKAIDEGNLKGMFSGKDRISEQIVAFSTRQCLDANRWITMPSLSSFQNLKELDLHKSRYMRQLDASVCDLVNLETLILTRCEKLVSLPDGIGRLQNLRELDMTDASELSSLPESLGDLINLKKLCIGGHCGSGNKVLKSLPSTLGNMKALEILCLDKCKALESLPESIGKLVDLRQLHMRECKEVKKLPPSIGNLRNVVEVVLSKCTGLTSLPPSIGKWVSLEDLTLSKCKGITQLPDSISDLKNLCILDLRACKNLTSLPRQTGDLSNLTSLDLRNCKRLESLPVSLGVLTKLEVLDISDCVDLVIPKQLEMLKDIAVGWDDSKVE